MRSISSLLGTFTTTPSVLWVKFTGEASAISSQIHFFQLKLLGRWLRDCIDQVAQGLDHREANQRLQFFGGI
jgi:hypothetical protein